MIQVSDIDWGNKSEFIVSTSLDQTSRIYTWWNNPILNRKTWHEVSRAQVHGYDINAIKFLSLKNKLSEGDDRNLCSLLVCGADEKILRLLEPPAPFINTVNSFTDSKLRLYYPDQTAEADVLEDKNKVIYKTKSEGGYSVLGLMIKATKVDKITCYTGDDEENIEELENNFDIQYDYKSPPIEDYLFKHTLWPEINKLYGHGYEIVSLDTNRDGTLIASTCKSQTATHSSIFLWNSQTCQLSQKLTGHNYTVLQVKFSPTGKYLSGVSRDRQTSLYLKSDDGQYQNIFLQTTHAKLIHAVAFSSDEKLLAAGSRDKTLKLWKLSESGLADLATLKFEDGVRSLEFSSQPLNSGNHIMWVGLENGHIVVLQMDNEGKSEILITLDDNRAHAGPVNAIKCGYKLEGAETYVAASAGDDTTLRVYEYTFE